MVAASMGKPTRSVPPRFGAVWASASVAPRSPRATTGVNAPDAAAQRRRKLRREASRAPAPNGSPCPIDSASSVVALVEERGDAPRAAGWTCQPILSRRCPGVNGLEQRGCGCAVATRARRLRARVSGWSTSWFRTRLPGSRLRCRLHRARCSSSDGISAARSTGRAGRLSSAGSGTPFASTGPSPDMPPPHRARPHTPEIARRLQLRTRNQSALRVARVSPRARQRPRILNRCAEPGQGQFAHTFSCSDILLSHR